MSVGISIVSFNTKDHLHQVLKDLLNQDYSGHLSIYVLDNDSKDGSAEMVEKDFKNVKLIRSNQNLGFAKGQNKIIKELKTDFIVLINPDTRISKNTVKSMVNFMELNPKCGISSCVIKRSDGSTDSNGGDLPFGMALFSWLFNLETLGIKSNFHRSDEEFYQGQKDLGWVGGTLMVINKKVIEKIGLLNEDYFMYIEDTEYCYRAKKAGFEIKINPEVEITHISGASSKNPRLAQWKGEFKGLLKFYTSQVGVLAALGVRILIYFSTLLRMLAFSLLGRFSVVKTYGKVITSI